jgi:hypothetical protein
MNVEKNKSRSVRLRGYQGLRAKACMVVSTPPDSECAGRDFLLRYALWRTERWLQWLPHLDR